jgi:hypothetical protein
MKAKYGFLRRESPRAIAGRIAKQRKRLQNPQPLPFVPNAAQAK